MTKASENKFPGILLNEAANDGSDFTNPDADYRRLFLGEDGQLHVKDSAGAVTGIGDVTTDAAWAAKGDLIVGTANNTAAILTAGTNDYVLTAASGEATGLKWAAAGAGTSMATDTLWDAAGDLAVGTGANTGGRLAIGTTGKILKVVAGTPAWYTSEWDTIIVKASDDTVTNSATLVSDSELLWTAAAGDMWRFEATIIYHTDGTGDYKCDFGASAGTFQAAFRYMGSDTTANAILVSTGIKDNDVTSTTDIAAGGGTTTVDRVILIEGIIKEVSEAATISFRSAQNTQTAGQDAVTLTGSMLKLKKLL
jgi:hypothetical protein